MGIINSAQSVIYEEIPRSKTLVEDVVLNRRTMLWNG